MAQILPPFACEISDAAQAGLRWLSKRVKRPSRVLMEEAMSYRLVAQEEPARGIKRIVCEQIDQTLQELVDNEVDRHTRVHQARKRFKKIRGVVRLVRMELGDVGLVCRWGQIANLSPSAMLESCGFWHCPCSTT